MRGEGNGQRPYPGDRFRTCEGEREHGHLGTEGARRGTGRTPAQGTGAECNGQKRGAAPQEQGRQVRQGPTQRFGKQERTGGDKGQEQKMGEGPGPTPGRQEQGGQVYEQQDPLQPHGSRCTHQCKTGQGQKAELPEPVERGYGEPCDHGHQGVPCRREGQPTVARYRPKTSGKVVEAGTGVGELCSGHWLQ